MDKDQHKSGCQRRKGLFDPGIMPIFIPQALFGLVFTMVSFYIGYYHGDFILPTLTTSGAGNIDLSARLAYALCCSLPMILSLFAGIQMVGIRRGLTSAVNPLSGNEGLIQVDKNYLSNTLEQFVVSFTLILIIAAYADSIQVLRLLPVYSAVFTTGRILFWIGYRISPFYRSVGMSTGFISTYVMLGITLYYSWTKGLAAVLGMPLLANDSHILGHEEL